MAFSTTLTSGSHILLELGYAGILGRGRVAPAALVSLEVRTPVDSSEALIERLSATLTFDGEPLSMAEFSPAMVHHSGTVLQAAFPMSARALSFVGDGARGDALGFRLQLAALLRVRRMRDDPQALIKPDDPIGEWTAKVPSPVDLPFTVPRSVWFSSVLTPLSGSVFVPLEIELPRASSDALAASIAHLADADRAYANGDDPAVFSYCRAALEALPGYPNAMTATVVNEGKRKALDALLGSTGRFLHQGRHVSQQPSDAGQFAVDHRDASLALNSTRLLVVYVARL